jgi:hypothetical protein
MEARREEKKNEFKGGGTRHWRMSGEWETENGNAR